MSLYGYATECAGLVQELIDSISMKDIDQLRADCSALGFSKWNNWCADNLEDTLAYIRATPSQRAHKKKWQEPVYRCRIVMATIGILTGAYHLLNGIDKHELEAGLSYREMAARAASVYLAIVYANPVPDWPFGGIDPFDGR
jgi:hypothetical protein